MAARVGDLDVAHTGMIGERVIDERLCTTAVAAPRTSEFEDRGSRERLDVGPQRRRFGVFVGNGHRE
jgi:hypothetical protein